MKLNSTTATLVLLIWLSSASSAEAAPIVFPDDSCHEPQQINWVLSPVGIGAIVIRLDLVSTGDCEEIDSSSQGSGGGGGFGGGGGGIPGGGSASGQSSGPNTNGAFAADGELELKDPSDLGDLPPSFTGDLPLFGDGNDRPGGGGNDPPGIIGGSLNSLLETFPLLSDDEFGPGDSGDEGPNDQGLAVVPEPGSFLLLGTGLALAVRRLRRRRC